MNYDMNYVRLLNLLERLGIREDLPEDLCYESARNNGWALQEVRWDETNLTKEK